MFIVLHILVDIFFGHSLICASAIQVDLIFVFFEKLGVGNRSWMVINPVIFRYIDPAFIIPSVKLVVKYVLLVTLHPFSTHKVCWCVSFAIGVEVVLFLQCPELLIFRMGIGYRLRLLMPLLRAVNYVQVLRAHVRSVVWLICPLAGATTVTLVNIHSTLCFLVTAIASHIDISSLILASFHTYNISKLCFDFDI